MTGFDRLGASLAVAAALPCLACTNDAPEQISTARSAIHRGLHDLDDPVSNSVVQVRDISGAPYVRCTGTLVTPGLVLTAAHCVYRIVLNDMGNDDPCDDIERAGVPTDFEVEVNYWRNAGTNTFPVQQMVIRENLIGTGRCTLDLIEDTGDVALLVLANDVPKGDAVPQYPMLDATFSRGHLWTHLEAWAAIWFSGYGRRIADPPTWSDRREMQAFHQFSLVTNYDKDRGGDPVAGITMFPKLGAIVGTLQGDSGGPLFFGRNQDLIVDPWPRFQVGISNLTHVDDTEAPSGWVEIGQAGVRNWIVDQASDLESTLGTNRPGRWYHERDYVDDSPAEMPYDADGNQYYDWRAGTCPTTFFQGRVHAGGVLAPSIPHLASNPPALYAEEDLFLNDRVHVYSASGDPVTVAAGNEVLRLQDEVNIHKYRAIDPMPDQSEAEVGLHGWERHTYVRIGADAEIDGTVVTTGGILTTGPRSQVDDYWLPLSTEVYEGSLPYLPDPSLWNRDPTSIPQLRMSFPFPPDTARAYQTWDSYVWPDRMREGLSPWYDHHQLPANPGVFYDTLKVDNWQVLYLEPGVYLADRLQVEPEGILVLPCDPAYLAANGHCENVTILVRAGMDVKSYPIVGLNTDPSIGWDEGAPPAATSFLLGYFGTSEAFLHYLAMTVVAPHAKVTLFTANPPNRERHHIGSVYAKSVEVHQDSQFEHVPFICDP